MYILSIAKILPDRLPIYRSAHACISTHTYIRAHLMKTTGATSRQVHTAATFRLYISEKIKMDQF